MAAAPTGIKARQNEGVLELQWPYGTYRLPYRVVRGRCPCAVCVNEVTGVRVVDVEDVPLSIAPINMQFAGNYALKIVWSDRHESGIFTWEYLELLCKDFDAAMTKAD